MTKPVNNDSSQSQNPKESNKSEGVLSTPSSRGAESKKVTVVKQPTGVVDKVTAFCANLFSKTDATPPPSSSDPKEQAAKNRFLTTINSYFKAHKEGNLNINPRAIFLEVEKLRKSIPKTSPLNYAIANFSTYLENAERSSERVSVSLLIKFVVDVSMSELMSIQPSSETSGQDQESKMLSWATGEVVVNKKNSRTLSAEEKTFLTSFIDLFKEVAASDDSRLRFCNHMLAGKVSGNFRR